MSIKMKGALKPEAIAELIQDGSSLMIGGFMAVGTPERIIDALVHRGRKNLTVIANDTAMPGKGIGKLITAGLVSRVIASHIGLNPETQKMMVSRLESLGAAQSFVLAKKRQSPKVSPSFTPIWLKRFQNRIWTMLPKTFWG